MQVLACSTFFIIHVSQDTSQRFAIICSFCFLICFHSRFKSLFLKQWLLTKSRPIRTIIVFLLNAFVVQFFSAWGWLATVGDNDDLVGLFTLFLVVFWGIYALTIAEDLCTEKRDRIREVNIFLSFQKVIVFITTLCIITTRFDLVQNELFVVVFTGYAYDGHERHALLCEFLRLRAHPRLCVLGRRSHCRRSLDPN